MSCGAWVLALRDFPQPLLRMQRLRMWGTLMAAEEAPPPRGKSITIIFKL